MSNSRTPLITEADLRLTHYQVFYLVRSGQWSGIKFAQWATALTDCAQAIERQRAAAAQPVL